MRILATCFLLLITQLSTADMRQKLAAQPTYLDAKLSPDGSKLAIRVRVEEGIGVMTFDTRNMERIGWLRPTRFEAGGLHWANNERLIIEIGEQKGAREQTTSFGEIYAINYDGEKGDFIYGIRAGDGRSGSRTSTRSNEPVWANVIDPLPDDNKHILVSSEPFSRYGSEIPTVIRLNVNNGRTREIIRAPIQKPYFMTDQEGEVRVAIGTDRNNEVHAYYRDADSREWEKIEDGVDINFFPITMDDANNELWFVGRAGSDKAGLHRMNMESRQITTVYEHDLVDVSGVQLAADRKAVLAMRVDPGFPSFLMLGKKHQQAATYRQLLEQFPGMGVDIVSQSQDGSKMVILAESDVYPGLFYLYDETRKENKLSFLFQQFPELPSDQLTAVEPVSFKVRSSETIHGYLTRGHNARGKTGKGPTVILVDGGPHYIRDYWRYDPDVQMLASLGINVIQVNFRGSGGYGLSYGESGYREWGRLIQHDIIDATRWAITEGIADPKKVCIMGASFGGYSAVQAAILEPELFKCSVAVAGVYDLPMLYSKGDVQQAYFGELYLEKVIGKDESPLAEFSPVNHVRKLKSELLIVHGREDQRAPINQARALMKALDDAGIKYRKHIEDKEGHGFFSAENKLEYYELVADFPGDQLDLN